MQDSECKVDPGEIFCMSLEKRKSSEGLRVGRSLEVCSRRIDENEWMVWIYIWVSTVKEGLRKMAEEGLTSFDVFYW